MKLQGKWAKVRPWQLADAESVAQLANDRDIWRNLRDAFPHPYTVANAEEYLTLASQALPQTAFAIDLDGQAVGSIGLRLNTDVHRFTAELGYWLGRPFWGRGIMTQAVAALTDYGFETLGLQRIYAEPFAHNTASARVLEKTGYVLEGRLRHRMVKEGEVLDQLLYAKIRGPDARTPNGEGSRR